MHPLRCHINICYVTATFVNVEETYDKNNNLKEQTWESSSVLTQTNRVRNRCLQKKKKNREREKEKKQFGLYQPTYTLKNISARQWQLLWMLKKPIIRTAIWNSIPPPPQKKKKEKKDWPWSAYTTQKYAEKKTILLYCKQNCNTLLFVLCIALLGIQQNLLTIHIHTHSVWHKTTSIMKPLMKDHFHRKKPNDRPLPQWNPWWNTTSIVKSGERPLP